MFSEEQQVLSKLERTVGLTRDAALRELRGLCLDSFGEIFINLPLKDYPRLSAVLPRMATAETQQAWTGSHGYPLLRESLTFVRAMWHTYERFSARPLSDARILDYGCGYGRLLRLMLFFADETRLHGCDPWDRSIQLCQEAGFGCDLRLTDYLPESLPYAERSFDLIYAFSVFTHTSELSTRTALAALANVIKPEGVLVITIRPREYWGHHAPLEPGERERLEAAHVDRGFAFRPHNRQAIQGDITYGDTSMSLEFLAREFPAWSIISSERTIDAPYQRIVYLRGCN
ncbi:MAG: class I SAM-dependent methyltransferase [Betaproteobacteria bacterium]